MFKYILLNFDTDDVWGLIKIVLHSLLQALQIILSFVTIGKSRP